MVSQADPQNDPLDIVAFLDRWLAANYDETSYSDIKPMTVRRARDEIVALRQANPLEAHGVRAAMVAVSKGARAEALEEAALAIQAAFPADDHQFEIGHLVANNCADVIRALKKKP